MNTRCKKALTLVEVLVAVAIVVIAAVIFLPVIDKLKDSAAERNTQAVFTVLDSALEKYFASNKPARFDESDSFYIHSRFPFDGRDHWDVKPDRWEEGDSILSLGDCEDILGIEIDNFPASIVDGSREFINVMLCLQLWLVPECRELLEMIPDKCINRRLKGEIIEPDIDGEPAAIFLINDGWGEPLRYWYDGKMSFPELRSAGPDGKPDTDDDIVN